MNIKKITLFTVTCLSAVAGVFLLNDSSTERYFPRANTAFDIANQEAHGAFEYLASIRNNRSTGIISTQEIARAQNQAAKMRKGNKSLNISWSFKGPDNVGGRTRALLIDRANSDHMFAGGVSGGLWESTNAGQSWFPYDQTFSVVNISTIAQSSNGTIYVGTGSAFDRPRNSKNKGSSFAGTGLYKLTGNGGYEFLIGPDESLDFDEPWSQINEIAIDPNNPQRIWIAMNTGVQESLDGGDSWNRPTNGPPTNSNLAADDIQMTSDGKIVVSYTVVPPAGNSSVVFTSRDNGANWTSTSFARGSRAEVAIAPSNTNIMYAAVGQFASVISNSCTQGVYRSSDAGLTWVPLLNTPDYFGAGGSCQGDYDNAIVVFPNDPGKIIVGGISLFQWIQSSTDPAPIQGEWRAFATTNEFNGFDGSRNLNYVHADKHTFVFNPSDSNELYIGTDGGVAFTNNVNSLRPRFGQYNLGYNVTQFYDIAVGGQDIVTAGAQDNGTQLVGFGFNTGKSGTEVNGGDGFESELFMINPSLGFVSSQNGNYRRLQGIGSTLSNSTFNVADVFSGKLADICDIGGGPCSTPGSGSFYTTMAKWESFNHTATKDSVLVVLTLSELPPLKAGTIIPFESKNNSHPLQETLTEDVFPAKADTVWAIQSKLDTVPKALNLNGITTVITAFDTILIFPPDNSPGPDTMVFKFRGGDVDTVLFRYGTPVIYTNVFYKPTITSRNLSVLVTADSNSVQYIDPKIEFVYRLEFPDLVQSTVAIFNVRGANAASPVDNGRKDVWISKDLLKGSSVDEPKWILVANSQSKPTRSNESSALCASFSNDGNRLYYGTVAGEVYRIDNINEIDVSQLGTGKPDDFTVLNTVSQRRIGVFAGRAVTGIAIDPQNDDNMIVTLGNYGSSNYVMRTTNATSNGTVQFLNISGSGNTALPSAPVYEAMIDYKDNNKVLLATELGVFGTENAFNIIDTTFTLLVSADTIVADTTYIVADTIITIDSTIIPVDSIISYDTVSVADTFYIPIRIRIDSSVIPPDTIVLDSVRIIRFNEVLSIRDTLIIPADTIINRDTLTIAADTMYVAADTSVAIYDTLVNADPNVEWTEENIGLGRVPVHSIKQMTFGLERGAINQGKVYIGTHGRGVFETDQFVGLEERVDNTRTSVAKKNGLIVYPNPVVDNLKVDVIVNSAGTANIQVFSLSGQLVRDLTQSLSKGKNTISLEMGEIEKGTYIIRTIQNGVTSTGKFIKQ